MRIIGSLCFLLGLFACALPARAQDVNLQHPPDIRSNQPSKAEALKARLNSAQFQKDSSELSSLCASIPADMDDLKRGVLPKDMVDKLKRLEKLSKRVREELAP